MEGRHADFTLQYFSEGCAKILICRVKIFLSGQDMRGITRGISQLVHVMRYKLHMVRDDPSCQQY